MLHVISLMLATTLAGSPLHRLDVVDRVPKFVSFYEAASRTASSEQERWDLWQRLDGIAAVPPGPDGQAMARRLLDAAWPRYDALVPRLSALTTDVTEDAQSDFSKINELYADSDTAIETRLVLYVGQFDNNSYSIPPATDSPATVVFPVENVLGTLALAHELAHTVNAQLSHAQNGFGQPVGETVFLEGLAMHTAQAVVPGLPDASYVSTPGDDAWMPSCVSKRKQIIAGIAPYLSKSGREVAMKFTFGQGTTGMDREAYCAGWFAVAYLLKHGHTFPELARIPESQMIAVVREAIERMDD